MNRNSQLAIRKAQLENRKSKIENALAQLFADLPTLARVGGHIALMVLVVAAITAGELRLAFAQTRDAAAVSADAPSAAR